MMSAGVYMDHLSGLWLLESLVSVRSSPLKPLIEMYVVTLCGNREIKLFCSPLSLQYLAPHLYQCLKTLRQQLWCAGTHQM